MNWDHPIHSFTDPNVEPQTPTRTPTFDDTAFQTPKFESSFYDPRITWNTADPYASSPELTKTGHRFEQTSNQRVPNPGDGIVSRNKPVEDAGRGVRQDNGSTNCGSANAESVDSAKRSAASMQTPPPTSTLRRKTQDRNTVVVAPSNLSTPVQPSYSGQPLETPSRVIGFSSNLFGLQGSPDLFNLSSNPTATSPFFSRHQMPWNQECEGTESGMDLSGAYSDPFGPSNPTTLGSFEPSRMVNTHLDTPQMSVMHDSIRFNAHTIALESRGLEPDHATLHSSIATSPRAPPPHSEDPSMFLSSPARRFGFSEPTFSPPARPRVETRRPYHYQTEELERERRDKEIQNLHRSKSSGRRQKVARVESVSYVQTESGKPTVKRSATHSGAPPLSISRHQRQSSFSNAGQVIGGGGVKKTSSKGRTSPLKTQLSPLPHSSSVPLPAPMESLVLKISKDGLATTEMKLISESPTRLQPGIHGVVSGESSTEIESDDEPDSSITHSQNPSFAFPDTVPRRPDFVRAQSSSRPHSKSSSYSSTAASTHSGRHSPRARSTHSRQSQQENWNQQRHSMKSSSSHSRGQSITDSDITYEEDGAGDAQHALMQVLKGRKRHSRQSRPDKKSASQPFRPSTLPTLPSSPPPYCDRSLSRPASSNSPTTITDPDAPTPVTDRQNNPSTGTRCIGNGCHQFTCASIALKRLNVAPASVSRLRPSETLRPWPVNPMEGGSDRGLAHPAYPLIGK
ncbi:hypothetical protein PRK78_000031 [Emydomyces testavorans]|uniref:Uncharacterized protein n=1 Tax=Emydomyces testavorans TaxID=2070801 RepID=A0AAF0IFG0_9EURO|nr:hypothetical protein PRK78_000031 [Emydomyces testavorans]